MPNLHSSLCYFRNNVALGRWTTAVHILRQLVILMASCAFIVFLSFTWHGATIKPQHAMWDFSAAAQNLQHKSLLPLDAADIMAFALAALVAFIAAGCGIGGGGILLPIFVLVCNFGMHEAIALSNITVLGSSFGNAIMNLGKRHPHLKRPLIDWDLILVMEPMTILGAIFGAYMDAVLPSWMTASLLAMVLTLISRMLLAKGLNMYRKESRARGSGAAEPLLQPNGSPSHPSEQPDTIHHHNQQHAAISSSDWTAAALLELDPASAPTSRTASPGRASPAAVQRNGTYSLVHGRRCNDEKKRHTLTVPQPAAADGRVLVAEAAAGEEDPDSQALGSTLYNQQQKQHVWVWRSDEESQVSSETDVADVAAAMAAEAEHERLLQQEAKQVPPLKFMLLLLLTSWMAASDTIKGYQPCGSARYWALVLSNGGTCVAVTLAMRRHLLRRTALKERLGIPVADGEVRWNSLTTLVYPVLCSGAGIVAGLFGVGGGIVKGPLMLGLGVLPEVAAASSATMILFTTSAASICNWQFGFLDPQYAGVLMVVAFIATLAGQLAMTKAVQHFGRPSLMVFVMASLLLASTAAMYYSAAVQLSIVRQHPEQAFEFEELCGHKHEQEPSD